MNVTVQLQIASEEPQLPHQSDFETWINTALNNHRDTAEINVRIVDIPESQALNKQYRHKDKPTNVLSFHCELPEGVSLPILGDLVICAPVVVAEAKQQAKSPIAHWAHLTIHGVLHLLGYDHESETEAGIMENLEIKLLKQLGYDNPYYIEQVGASHNHE